MDEADQRIVGILVENARISLKELSQRIGLSSPSTAQRLRRIEERGILKSFTIDLDPKALGYSLQVIVRINPLPGALHLVEQAIRDTPEFIECDKVTGEDCFIGRLWVRSVEHLDHVLDRISERARTNTAIIKATPVKRRLPPLF